MWLKFLAVVLPDSKSLMYRPLIPPVVPQQEYPLRLGFVVNARKILILTGFLKHGFPREIA